MSFEGSSIQVEHQSAWSSDDAVIYGGGQTTTEAATGGVLSLTENLHTETSGQQINGINVAWMDG